MNALPNMHASRREGLRPVNYRIFGVLGLVVALAGCAGPAGTPQVVDMRYSLADTAKVLFMDRAVRHAVECTGLQVINRKDGRLEVIVSLKNLRRETLALQVGAMFTGPAGEPLTAEPVWHRLTPEGNNTVVARFVSQDGRAADFSVRVRMAK